MIDAAGKTTELEPDDLSGRQVVVRGGEIDSQELFKTEREVRIRHGDQTYRLRLTALNKLILTK